MSDLEFFLLLCLYGSVCALFGISYGRWSERRKHD